MSRSPALPRRCDRPRRTCVIVPVAWLLASVPQWGARGDEQVDAAPDGGK